MRPERNYRIEVDHPVFLGGRDADGNSQPLVALDLSPDCPDYVTPDGVEVWIERKVQKTRFLDADGNQVGPVHANLVPAIVWAAANEWRSPSSPKWLDDAVIADVKAGGAPDDRHAEAGAWKP